MAVQLYFFVYFIAYECTVPKNVKAGSKKIQNCHFWSSRTRK